MFVGIFIIFKFFHNCFNSFRSTSSSNVNNQLMTQSMYSRRSSERDQVFILTVTVVIVALTALMMKSGVDGLVVLT